MCEGIASCCHISDIAVWCRIRHLHLDFHQDMKLLGAWDLVGHILPEKYS